MQTSLSRELFVLFLQNLSRKITAVDTVLDRGNVMIILVKQLLNDAFHVEKIQLSHEPKAQVPQIFDFDADVIVGTCPTDSLDVLELALFCKVSFAIYQPDLNHILPTLQKFSASKYRQISKLIYLSAEYFQQDLDMLQTLSEDFQLVFEGDYQEIFHNLAFDVRERELDFFLED